MDSLTKLSLTIINSIGIYFLLTLPSEIYLITNLKHGFAYPGWVCLLCALASGILGNIVTNYEERIIMKRRGN